MVKKRINTATATEENTIDTQRIEIPTEQRHQLNKNMFLYFSFLQGQTV